MEQLEQQCTKCSSVFPIELYKNLKTGKITKQCIHCREKCNKAEEQKKQKCEDIQNFCKTCKTQYDNSDEFKEGNKVFKTCSKCRIQNRKLEANRGKRNRTEYYQSEKYKTAKKNKILNNTQEEEKKRKAKNREYTKIHRQKKKENDPEYYTKNAKRARDYRNTHPEIKTNYNDNRRINMNNKFKTYTDYAKRKNINFNISQQEFNDIIKQSCYYCNTQQFRTLNGITRINTEECYISSNVIPCCSTCNYMKYNHTEETFLLLIITILSYQNLIENKEFNYEHNKDINGVYYAKYKNRANNKEFIFELSYQEFNQICESPCYLCGKENSSTHKNGIDRIDNTKGYTLDNCKSCCGVCNKLKKDIPLDLFLKKLQEIYIYITKQPVYDNNINTYTSIINELQSETVEDLLYSQIIQSDIQLDDSNDKIFAYRKWLHYSNLSETLKELDKLILNKNEIDFNEEFETFYSSINQDDILYINVFYCFDNNDII